MSSSLYVRDIGDQVLPEAVTLARLAALPRHFEPGTEVAFARKEDEIGVIEVACVELCGAISPSPRFILHAHPDGEMVVFGARSSLIHLIDLLNALGLDEGVITSTLDGSHTPDRADAPIPQEWVDASGGRVGFSSGAFFKEGPVGSIKPALEGSYKVIELSALRLSEFEQLADAILRQADGRPRGVHSDWSKEYVSLHAPTTNDLAEDGRSLWDAATLEKVIQVSVHVDSVLLHPDTISSAEVHRIGEVLGEKLCWENLDCRREEWAYAQPLTELLQLTPQAGLCIDLPHTKTVDPTGELARRLLASFGSHVRQLHLSGIRSNGHHRALNAADIEWLNPILQLTLQTTTPPAWIVESPVSS